MTELIGDACKPSELIVPNKATADLPTGANGSLYYDATTNKLKVWTGAAYETVTSA